MNEFTSSCIHDWYTDAKYDSFIFLTFESVQLGYCVVTQYIHFYIQLNMKWAFCSNPCHRSFWDVWGILMGLWKWKVKFSKVVLIWERLCKKFISCDMTTFNSPIMDEFASKLQICIDDKSCKKKNPLKKEITLHAVCFFINQQTHHITSFAGQHSMCKQVFHGMLED